LINRAEDLTNELAVAPWEHLSDAELLDVAQLLVPVSAAVGALFPYPNPIGMPTTWDPQSDPEAASVPAVPAA
jgi:hypothetical protein